MNDRRTRGRSVISAHTKSPVRLSATLDAGTIEELVALLTPLVALELGISASPSPPHDRFVAPQGAAEYLGITRKRIYDLTSAGALRPDGRDGRTPLYRLSTLDRYADT